MKSMPVSTKRQPFTQGGKKFVPTKRGSGWMSINLVTGERQLWLKRRGWRHLPTKPLRLPRDGFFPEKPPTIRPGPKTGQLGRYEALQP